MKICKIIFSTNRLEFLIPTLTSCSENIDWGDHEVDGLFIDDMPKDRNDDQITELANIHGYNNVILHKENKGLGYTWHESYEWLKDKGYDYILHQEDDLIVKGPIKIDNFIDAMTHKSVYAIHLKYQDDWYWKDKVIEYDWLKDNPNFNYNFNIELSNNINKHYNKPPIKDDNDFHIMFDTSFSFYQSNLILESYKLAVADGRGLNNDNWIAEGTFGRYVRNIIKTNKMGLIIVDKDNKELLEHIGEWSWGHRSTLKSIINGHNNEYQKTKMKQMLNNHYEKINSRTWSKWTSSD